LVDIESYVEVQDTAGQPIKIYSLFSRRWADIRDLSGDEIYRAQEKLAVGRVVITMRYFPGLLETMRIRFQERVYDIVTVDDIEYRHITYECVCETGLIP